MKNPKVHIDTLKSKCNICSRSYL